MDGHSKWNQRNEKHHVASIFKKSHESRVQGKTLERFGKNKMITKAKGFIKSAKISMKNELENIHFGEWNWLQLKFSQLAKQILYQIVLYNTYNLVPLKAMDSIVVILLNSNIWIFLYGF